MTQKTKFLLATALFGFSFSAPLQEREVPQEHSHEPILVSVHKFLLMDNPLGIRDPVYGLLGDKAASVGAGMVTNLKCLQRKTADQAFTNAKAAKDIPGMTNALIYAALERNTGGVGKASDACDEPATNPEINALKQHQDPASPGATEANKALVLELAIQIASIGGKPTDAAMSATFAPGKIGDQTGKGNTCDDQDDPNGCIFTKKLIQVEATPEEIEAAVKSRGSSKSSTASSDSTTNSKSTEKAVQKRNQVASDINPEEFVKSTYRSNKFPEIIPRDIDRPVSDNINENDNDNVKRDDNLGKSGKGKKKGGKGKKKGGKGKKKGGKGKKKGGKGKKKGGQGKMNGGKGNKGDKKNNSAGSKD